MTMAVGPFVASSGVKGDVVTATGVATVGVDVAVATAAAPSRSRSTAGDMAAILSSFPKIWNDFMKNETVQKTDQ